MQIYYVERTDGYSYDDYDSFVCAANSKDEAKLMCPSEYYGWHEGKFRWITNDGGFEMSGGMSSCSSWVDNLDNLDVTEVGTAHTDAPYIICASYNAG